MRFEVHGAIDALQDQRTAQSRNLQPRFRELIRACAYARLGRAEDARNWYAKAIGNPPDTDMRTLFYTRHFVSEYERICGNPVKARRPNSMRD